MLDVRPETWMSRWRLTPDGEPISTPHTGSLLIPVLHDGAPAILKITTEEEEVRGANLMVWYGGDGAARVLAHEGPALLLERLTGTRDLARMARAGHDDEASRIICAVVTRLHAPRSRPLPASLVPMAVWFRQLEPAAARYGGILTKSAAAAGELLASPQEIVALHGDVHHGNILDGGERGWLAIDPKGVLGERGFDYANLFRNPDAMVATAPGRLQRQVRIVAEAGKLDPRRLLTWILAYAGLGAAWTLDSGGEDGAGLTIAAAAASQLGV
jgi:streptomycin 6-kinase